MFGACVVQHDTVRCRPRLLAGLDHTPRYYAGLDHASIAHGYSLCCLRLQAWMTAVLVFCIFAFTDPDGAVPDGAGPATIGATVRSAPHGLA